MPGWHAATITPASPPRQRGRIVNQLATTAFLLLVGAVGFLAINVHPPETPDRKTWVPALTQALEGIPGVTDTSLVETTFTPAELPEGMREAVYYQLVIPPGATLPYPGGLFCGCRVETITRGVGLEIVQSGQYRVRLDAPVRVQRAGSARPDEIASDTEVTLATGDAIIFPDYAATGDMRNAGDEPLTLLGVVINDMAPSGTPVPRPPSGLQAEALAHASVSTWEHFPPGLLHVALRQVTLPPGTTVGPYQPVGLQAMHVQSGVVLRNFVLAGESAPSGRPLPQFTGLTVPFIALAPGRRETLATDGDQPAELLALIIEPAVGNLQSSRP
jgi:hypothetical protein